MDRYHIGIRLKGYARDYFKALTCAISKKFDLDALSEKRIVPHVTLLRPFTTNNESGLITSFGEVLSNYTNPIFYNLNGFGVFDNEEKVIYAKLDKNSDLEDIALDLESGLSNKIKFLVDKIKLPSEEDRLNLHCSIASKGINKYFNEIEHFIEGQNFPKTTCPLLRIYLLKNNFILREFDFYLKKNLERWDAINPFVFYETVENFKTATNIRISNEGILLPNPIF